MSNDDLRAFLDRFRQTWERQDVKALAACYADDCVVVSPIFSTITGRANVEKSFADVFKAFKMQKITVLDLVIGNEEPPRAALVWNVESMHVGEIFGMPASGRPISRTIAYILTLKDGLIAKETRIYDFTSMLMQLGVLKVKPAN